MAINGWCWWRVHIEFKECWINRKWWTIAEIYTIFKAIFDWSLCSTKDNLAGNFGSAWKTWISDLKICTDTEKVEKKLFRNTYRITCTSGLSNIHKKKNSNIVPFDNQQTENQLNRGQSRGIRNQSIIQPNSPLFHEVKLNWIKVLEFRWIADIDTPSNETMRRKKISNCLW